MNEQKMKVELLTSANNSFYATSVAEGEDNFLQLANAGTIVNWKVQSDGTMQPASSEVINKEHVEAYALYKGGTWWFKYRLKVKVNKAGVYYFTDAEGDTYKIAVYITGLEHYVDFNSGNPTIVRVLYVEY